MASRQRKTPPATGRPSPEQPAAPAQPAWRQPLPQTRAELIRKQMTVPQQKAAHGNPLTPVLSRTLQVGESMKLRHWISLLVLAAAATGMSQLLTFQQFTITAANVQVRGLTRASAEEIYAASELEGTNVFRVRATDAAGRVAEVPGVDSTEVHLRLPAQVIIDVVELVPLAIVQTAAETVWIGSDGTGIQQVGEPPNLTLIEVDGTVRNADGTVLPEIVQGLGAIHASRPDLTDIYYGTLEGLYFRASEGYTVYLGEGGAMTRKLALLEATQQQVVEGSLHPQEIDLRFDGYAMLK